MKQAEPETESFHEPERGISFSELLARAKGMIERDLPDSVWGRAEISKLGGKSGNLFPRLTERNELGDPLARVKGVICRREAANVAARFVEATGENLEPGIKNFCLARVRFEPLFGLDLLISDSVERLPASGVPWRTSTPVGHLGLAATGPWGDGMRHESTSWPGPCTKKLAPLTLNGIGTADNRSVQAA